MVNGQWEMGEESNRRWCRWPQMEIGADVIIDLRHLRFAPPSSTMTIDDFDPIAAPVRPTLFGLLTINHRQSTIPAPLCPCAYLPLEARSMIACRRPRR